MLEPMHPEMKCHVFSLKPTLRNPQVWQKELIPSAHPFLHSNTHVQKEEYNYKVQIAAQPSCSIKNPLWLVYLWLTSFDPQHHGVCCASPNSGSHYLPCHTMGASILSPFLPSSPPLTSYCSFCF